MGNQLEPMFVSLIVQVRRMKIKQFYGERFSLDSLKYAIVGMCWGLLDSNNGTCLASCSPTTQWEASPDW